ncbi:Site-specific DNA recombinase [Roseivivax marinus]|uniref:recombinase family protein n=1 Tax=Roseivivax marinus TaxID=1379903 RepID=UPI0008C19777|nr:recombinase family protein [Roseivivax marinus]SEL92852.1 Site-specific DNA recombinase [Roseivivax marinus]
MTRVAIYARFSSALQREASIEDQVRVCSDRATREGWTVMHTFTDMAISGASANRPGLQSLLDHAARGGINVVLCGALDRLSRDQADIATIYKQLAFQGVRIVTVAEGEVSELHVGLKGTMNQLFLKDLAAKTHRGLRGRVETGRSGGGNAYGYDVVRRLDPDGEPVKGERAINQGEAEIVRRIFREFADGASPIAIAHGLNAEHIPGPRGKLWRDTAIRGHRTRGTGILNNEHYVGRLVWNRMRYVKDPATGNRVSRMNPESDWTRTEVPELRIVDDVLWDRVKKRQGEIDATPRVAGIKKSRFWENKRGRYLLSGKLFCGACGGSVSNQGGDYLACSNARKLKTCDHTRSYKRDDMEDAVLDLLRERLMQPDAVAEFVVAYTEGVNGDRKADEAVRKRKQMALAQTERQLNGLYAAIADGLRTPGLLQQLHDLEARKSDLKIVLEAPAPSPVRLHPKLPELYRAKVAELAESLRDSEIKTQALDILRGLIERIVVRSSGKGESMTIELEGALTAMLDAAQPGALSDADASSIKVVAGGRNRRSLRVFKCRI